MGAASFCVAGAALGASPARFAWQVHLEHLRFAFRGRCSTGSTFIEVGGSLATSEAFGRRLVLLGRRRRSTWSTFIEVGGSLATSVRLLGAASFCLAGAGAALGAPS